MDWCSGDANSRNTSWLQRCEKEERSTVLNEAWAQGTALNTKRLISPPVSERAPRFLGPQLPGGEPPSRPASQVPPAPPKVQKGPARALLTTTGDYGWQPTTTKPLGPADPLRSRALASTDVTRIATATAAPKRPQ